MKKLIWLLWVLAGGVATAQLTTNAPRGEDIDNPEFENVGEAVAGDGPPVFLGGFWQEDGDVKTANGDDLDVGSWVAFLNWMVGSGNLTVNTTTPGAEFLEAPASGSDNVSVAFTNADASGDGSTERLTVTDGGGALTADIVFPAAGAGNTSAITGMTATADPNGATTHDDGTGTTAVVNAYNPGGTNLAATTTPQAIDELAVVNRPWTVDGAGTQIGNDDGHAHTAYAHRNGNVGIGTGTEANDGIHLLRTAKATNRSARFNGNVGVGVDASSDGLSNLLLGDHDGNAFIGLAQATATTRLLLSSTPTYSFVNAAGGPYISMHPKQYTQLAGATGLPADTMILGFDAAGGANATASQLLVGNTAQATLGNVDGVSPFDWRFVNRNAAGQTVRELQMLRQDVGAVTVASANYGKIYVNTAVEVFAMDGAGNATQLTSHPDYAYPIFAEVGAIPAFLLEMGLQPRVNVTRFADGRSMLDLRGYYLIGQPDGNYTVYDESGVELKSGYLEELNHE